MECYPGFVPSIESKTEVSTPENKRVPRSHLLPVQLCEVVEIFGYLRIACPERVLINRQGLPVQKIRLLILALQNKQAIGTNDT